MGKTEKQRININFPLGTLERVDAYAGEMTITRTAAILVLLNESLDNKQVVKAMSAMDGLVKSGVIK